MTWRGFSRQDVEQYIKDREDEVQLLTADRDSAMTQVDRLSERLEAARSEIDRLNARVNQLCQPPMDAVDLSDRLNRMIKLANTEAEEITSRAKAAAEHTWTKAEEAAAALRQRYQDMLDDLDKQRAQLLEEHRDVMAKAHSDVNAMTVEAEQRRLRADAEAEQRRTAIEEEFERSMAQQRAALDQEVRQARETSEAEAHKRVADATAHAEAIVTTATANAEAMMRDATEAAQRMERDASEKSRRMVREATDEVHRLRELRGRIHSQLHGALDLVHNASPLLTPIDGEDSLAHKENGQIVDESAGESTGASIDESGHEIDDEHAPADGVTA